MRLLVVEDEPSLLSIITKRLKEEGYGVDSAKDGREGENYISSAEYDCIILDLGDPYNALINRFYTNEFFTLHSIVRGHCTAVR